MVSIIPRPVRLVEADGAFTITPHTVIHPDAAALSEATLLARAISPALGFTPRIANPAAPAPLAEAILLRLMRKKADLGAEGYRLRISPRILRIEAAQTAGLFYGCQTLRQLLPAEVFAAAPVSDAAWSVPCVEIEDFPRFSWRGLMLDTGRHFFPLDFVKRFVDLAVMHKANVFHWHLTEDQGWRIEIKSHPRLTEIGAWRRETMIGCRSNAPLRFDGLRHGGFYTQAEIKELVAYAAERHIGVVPEIEMPGHSLAALASYPGLSCIGGSFDVACVWGVTKDVLCAGNDGVFRFLEAVLEEIISLFPGKFIHIGGDECPKDRWRECPKCQQRMKTEGLVDERELQSWFIRRIERFLNGRGRLLIGWDEILEGGLAPNAAVMSWRGIEGGIEAARTGHDVVMSPTTHCYLDHYQSKDTEREPLALGGCTPLDKVYSYNPIPEELTREQSAHVMGVQGNLWTECIPTQAQADYMVWPRGCALAEVAWSPPGGRSWDEFSERLAAHLPRLDRLGVKYRPLDK